jgi:hypothetical protein
LICKQNFSKKHNIEKNYNKKQRQRIFFLCLAVFTMLCAVVIAFAIVIPHYSDLAAVRREKAMLSQESARHREITPDSRQIITLSTCVYADSDERIVVQGALR